jgi:hypothetical protein
MLTKAELMEISNETLVLWASMIQDEADRRKVNIEAIPVHPGNVKDGRPSPPAVRLLRSLLTLPPTDIAKLDQIVAGWSKARRDEKPT